MDDKNVDLAAIDLALQNIFGQDVWNAEKAPDGVWDDSPKRTAERWVAAMREFTPEKTLPFKFTTFRAVANQLIIVAPIEFVSLCAHHLFPYYGTAYVGYIPNKLMVGVSKIPRLVHHFAKRPSVQERLTRQIASYMKDNLEAMGVAVVVRATHTCMSCRGVKEHNARMTTSEMRGVFLTASEARQEFLTLAGLT